MDCPPKKFKVSKLTDRPLKPFYIYRYFVHEKGSQEEWSVNWNRKRAVEAAAKELLLELRADSTLFLIDVESNLLYTQCDFLRSRYVTIDRNKEPYVRVKITQKYYTAERDVLVSHTRVYNIELRMLGSPIEDLGQCASRPEVRRAINFMLLADIKEKSRTSVVRLTEKNVGRVFKVAHDDQRVDTTTVTELSIYSRACHGLATSVQQVSVADSPTIDIGLELKITEEVGCFFGAANMLDFMVWDTVLKISTSPLDNAQVNAIREQYTEQLVIVKILFEGSKFAIKVIKHEGRLLLEQEIELNFEVPNEFKEKWEKCLLTPIGCLLPTEALAPGQILERSLTKNDFLKFALTLDERREIFEKNCAELIGHRNSYLEQFGYVLKPGCEEASLEQPIGGDGSKV